jgi:hypothetical protein
LSVFHGSSPGPASHHITIVSLVVAHALVLTRAAGGLRRPRVSTLARGTEYPGRPDVPPIDVSRRAFDRIAWAPDGRLGGIRLENLVEVWDPSQPDAPPVVLKRHLGALPREVDIAWAPDGRLATGDEDGFVRVWDPSQPDALPVVLEGDGFVSCVTSVAWAPDGRLASGHYDGLVRVWDPTHPNPPNLVLEGGKTEAESVAWAPDGRLAASYRDGVVRVWELRRPPPLPNLVLKGHGGQVDLLAWAPDGRLASWSNFGVVRAFDPCRPATPPVGFRHGERVRRLAWASDGRLQIHYGVLRWPDAPLEAARLWDPRWPDAPIVTLDRDAEMVDSVETPPDERLTTRAGGLVHVCAPRRPGRSVVVPRSLGWNSHRATVVEAVTPGGPVIALHPFLRTDVAVVLPGSEHVPPQPLDAERPARRRVVRADRVATLADGALHLYQPTEGGDVWKATALPGLYPACLAPNVDGDLVLQGPDLRALEALLDAVPTVPPPAWSALPVPFRVVDGQLRALGHDVDLARMSEVHTATPLKDGHWVVAGTDGVLVLVAPDGRHALRFRLRGTDGPRTEPVRQLAVIEDALVVGFEDAEPVRVRLPRFDTPLRIGRGGTPPPAGPRLLAGPVRQE